MILKRLLEQLGTERGWVLKTGVEAEYSLLRRTPRAGSRSPTRSTARPSPATRSRA
ncbi:hypothetical protein ACFQV8_09870 [Pseudonocardia benzenivorans]